MVEYNQKYCKWFNFEEPEKNRTYTCKAEESPHHEFDDRLASLGE